MQGSVHLPHDVVIRVGDVKTSCGIGEYSLRTIQLRAQWILTITVVATVVASAIVRINGPYHGDHVRCIVRRRVDVAYAVVPCVDHEKIAVR